MPHPHPSHRYVTFVNRDKRKLEATTQCVCVLYFVIINSCFKKQKKSTPVALRAGDTSVCFGIAAICKGFDVLEIPVMQEVARL